MLQETFLAVWRGAAGYRPAGARGGWLWGIARRQATPWLRGRGPAALLLPVLVAADGGHAADAADAALSRAAIIASTGSAGITFGWLAPMMAISAAALAGTTLARSANIGVAAGLVAWAITVLSSQSAVGQPGAAATHRTLFLPYLAVAAAGAALALYVTQTPRVTRIPRGSS